MAGDIPGGNWTVEIFLDIRINSFFQGISIYFLPADFFRYAAYPVDKQGQKKTNMAHFFAFAAWLKDACEYNQNTRMIAVDWGGDFPVAFPAMFEIAVALCSGNAGVEIVHTVADAILSKFFAALFRESPAVGTADGVIKKRLPLGEQAIGIVMQRNAAGGGFFKSLEIWFKNMRICFYFVHNSNIHQLFRKTRQGFWLAPAIHKYYSKNNENKWAVPAEKHHAQQDIAYLAGDSMNKVAVIIGCTGCDSCRWVCPVEAISFNHAGAYIDEQRCIGCGRCIDECASEAIRIQERTKGKNDGKCDA